MKIETIKLSQLRHGQEFPGASINARTAGRETDIDQMAASIAEEGLLQSLLVVQAPGKDGVFYVADGNRRLAGLRKLLKAKKILADAEIPAIVSDAADPVKALRKSLTAGMQHVTLHPVDQFETFVACIDEGDTAEKIAERYVLPVKVVKQRLALGKLSPVIREAWRKGKLTIDAAAAYASTPHHAAQEKHFKRGGWETTNVHNIRSALIGDKSDIDKLLKFVGEKAYTGAGGKLIEDLFGNKEGAKIADFGLLERLTSEKLKAKAAEFVEKGWGWAAPADDLPNDAEYNWPRKSNPTAEEKKKLGVILGVSYGGTLETKTGVIKPGVKGIKSNDGQSAPKVKKKKPGLLSNSLAQRLSETLTYGAGDAMAEDSSELALAFTLAAFVTNGKYGDPRHGSGGPVRLIERGLATMRDERSDRKKGKEQDFEDALPGIVKLPLKDKLAMLARIVGFSLDFQTQSAERLPLAEDDVTAVLDLMNGPKLNVAIRKRLDAEDYFKGISGALRLQAVREMEPDQESTVAKMKKAGQIAAAVALFNKSKNWLPPELRTSHYDGPSASKKGKVIAIADARKNSAKTKTKKSPATKRKAA